MMVTALHAALQHQFSSCHAGSGDQERHLGEFKKNYNQPVVTEGKNGQGNGLHRGVSIGAGVLIAVY